MKIRRKKTLGYAQTIENFFKGLESKLKLKNPIKFTSKRSLEALLFLVIFFGFFGLLAYKMSLPMMLNTFMQTAYHLLMETVFYIMAICVLMGAISKLMAEFGVVRLMENVLKPFMRPLYNLPGVAALGAVMTFLSDNPAIITLAKDKNFSRYFKKYQLVSLTNFGTAFGMGLVVLAFMTGLGYGKGALVGILGAVIGSIVSTRLMQYLSLKAYPDLDVPVSEGEGDEQQISFKSEGSVFMRFLNSILDGGKDGVGIGVAIIPGVLVISTVVMMMTFGPSGEGGVYQGVQGGFHFPLALRVHQSAADILPHHGVGCRGRRHRSGAPFHCGGHYRQQRCGGLHRYGYVLERLFEHAHRDARFPGLS